MPLRRRVTETLELVEMAGYAGTVSARTVRRPAAAGGPGPGAGLFTGGPPARRALLQPRRQTAGAGQDLAQAPAGRARADHAVRHPRPGRGAQPQRPDRGHERRERFSRSAPPRTSTVARPTRFVAEFLGHCNILAARAVDRDLGGHHRARPAPRTASRSPSRARTWPPATEVAAGRPARGHRALRPSSEAGRGERLQGRGSHRLVPRRPLPLRAGHRRPAADRHRHEVTSPARRSPCGYRPPPAASCRREAPAPVAAGDSAAQPKGTVHVRPPDSDQGVGIIFPSGMLGGGFTAETIKRGIAMGATAIAIDGGLDRLRPLLPGRRRGQDGRVRRGAGPADPARRRAGEPDPAHRRQLRHLGHGRRASTRSPRSPNGSPRRTACRSGWRASTASCGRRP